MKPIVWAGIVLIVLGVLIFAYQGINYTREKKVLDVGSVHVTTETHEFRFLEYLEGWQSLEWRGERQSLNSEWPLFLRGETSPDFAMNDPSRNREALE
jgi:hypothetical protein